MNGFILFDIHLSPGMRFLLSWIICQGGGTTLDGAVSSANAARSLPGRARVTRATVSGLVRRSYLEQHDNRLQVGDWAVDVLRRYEGNPDPVPVMRARAEAAAHHRENAAQCDEGVVDGA